MDEFESLKDLLAGLDNEIAAISSLPDSKQDVSPTSAGFQQIQQSFDTFKVQAEADYSEPGMLSFREGDIITVTSVDDARNVFFGEFGGQAGWFSRDYVSIVGRTDLGSVAASFASLSQATAPVVPATSSVCYLSCFLHQFFFKFRKHPF